MNSTEAKKLSLPDIMASLGYQPIKVMKNGMELWYNSPFRAEKDPSFHTSFLGGKWIWNDFGDKGGTVIDFVMRHENYYNVGQALKYLERFENKNLSFSFQQKKGRAESKVRSFERELEFISAKPIQNPLIISYLTKERFLDRKIALAYLEEVKYKNLNNQKEYFAFGMKNLSEGYEIRVATDKYPFKSALIKKDISHIQGIRNNKIVNLFEGMTDFLSLLTMMKTDNLLGDSIIMHSTKLLQRTKKFIEQQQYQSINAFLDNDKTGEKAVKELSQYFGDTVSDQSQLYLPHKDFNELLQSEQKGKSPFMR